MNEYGSIPIKLHLQNLVVGQSEPSCYRLPTAAPEDGYWKDPEPEIRVAFQAAVNPAACFWFTSASLRLAYSALSEESR